MIGVRAVQHQVMHRRMVVGCRLLQHIRNKSDDTKRLGFPPQPYRSIQHADQTKIISSSVDAAQDTLPDLPSRAPSLMEIRRARQQNFVEIVPPKYQESTSEKTRSWIYNAATIAICSLILVIFKLTTDDEAVSKQRMQLLASELRKTRAAAKRALQAAATETGEIPLNGTKVIKYYATGPINATKQILLHAADGETAALWGHVHAMLAENHPDVRVVSFHKTGVHFDPLRTVPLSLRVHEVDVMIKHMLQQQLAARKSSGWAWGGSSTAATNDATKFVLVSHGEGTWGALATASANPQIFRGLVCVMPLLMHRGRRTAWVDAVAAASRVTPRTDPEALQRHLDAPPLQADARMLAVDALRMQSAGGHVVKVMQTFGSPNANVTNAEKRLAEDMRRQRSKQPVLSEFDMELLMSQSPRLAGADVEADSHLHVAAITVAPDAVPGFVRKDQLLSTSTWLLQACNAIGVALMSPNDRTKVSSCRKSAAVDMAVELSNGVFKVPSTVNIDASADEQNPGVGISRIAKDASPLLFGVDKHVDDAMSVSGGPDDFELLRMDTALARLARLFSFEGKLVPRKSFSYLFMQREMAMFPQNFSVTLVEDRAPQQVKPSSTSNTWLESIGSWVAPKAPQGADIALIPLQAPGAVYDCVRRQLLNAPHPAEPRKYAMWPR